MSKYASAGGLGPCDAYILKVFKVVACEGQAFLLLVFQAGCPKGKKETVKEYLIGKGMSNNDFKKRFNTTLRKNIETSASEKEYDVTLLYACIKNACKDLADFNNESAWSVVGTELENYCSAIKEIRNDLAHGKEFKTELEMKVEIERLRDSLEKGYKKAGEKYPGVKSKIDNEILRMTKNVDQIIDSELLPGDIHKYRKEIEELREAILNCVKTDGVREIQENIKSLTNVDPASFISGREELKVTAIFTSLEVVREKRDLKDSISFSYKDLLQQKTEKGEDPSIFVVEGEAGAGKSTLAKLILAEWAEKDKKLRQMVGLDQYDLVLHAEYRNKSVSSFGHLLDYLMPNVSYRLRTEDIERAVLAMKVLLILDGMDEANAASRRLVEEIMTCKMKMTTNGGKLDIILTTRPQMLKELPSTCFNHLWVHIKIRGIKAEKRPDFVSKLHEEMKSEGKSKQDTQKLIDFVKKSDARLGEHFHLPLNLALLTYLWAAVGPERVESVTTATCLFINILKLIKKRTVSRIYENLPNDDKVEIGELTEKVEKYMQTLCKLSFKEIITGSLELSESSEIELRKFCDSLRLPSSEISAAFMNVRRVWNAGGYELHLIAPHKSMFEFYAAMWFVSRLQNTEPLDVKFNKSYLELLYAKKDISEHTLKEMLAVVKKDEKKSFKDTVEALIGSDSLENYQNVFLHISGLLGEDPKNLEEHAEELVDCLNMAGTTEEQWLDIIAESKCHKEITKHAAKNIKKQIIVRDGHTGAAASAFDHLKENLPVQVILECEVTYIPELDTFLKKLAKRKCMAELLFNHQWKNMTGGMSDERMQEMIKCKCQIYRFTGNLTSLSYIPASTEKIKIAFSNSDQAMSLCKEISDISDSHDFNYMGVHVVPGVQPEALSPLLLINEAKKMCGSVWISGVIDSNVVWACQVAQALQPPKGMFYSLMFPRSDLSIDGCKDLIHNLILHNIRLRPNSHMYVMSSSVQPLEVVPLRHLAKTKLDCEFDCVEEANIW